MAGKLLSFEKRKSSKSLREEFFSRELGIGAKKEIDELVALLKMARVSTLAICVCNPPALRTRIMDTLKKMVSDSNVKVYTVTVTEKDEHLVKILAEIERSRKFRQYEETHQNVAFSIGGIENIFKAKDTLRISRFYQNLNLYRDYFVHSKHPVLLWVNDSIASDMTTRAPDFWRARTKVAIFRPREEMIVADAAQISGLPVFYRDLADVKRRVGIIERLLQSLDPSQAREKVSYIMLSLNLGSLKTVQGLYDKAKDLYERSLKLAVEAEDKDLMVRSLQRLAFVKHIYGDSNAAVELLERSLKIAEELGDKHGIGTNLNQLGKIELARGNYDKAEELYQQSLKIAEELGDKQGIGANLKQLGMIELARGNYDKAEELYQQGLEIDREIRYKQGISITLHQLGVIQQKRGNYDKAEELYQQGLKIAKKLGYKQGISITLHQLGVIQQDRGNYDKAEELYQQSLKIDRKIRYERGISITLHQLGVIQQDRGNYDKAEELYQQGLKIAKKLGFKKAVASNMATLGFLLAQMGRLEEAFKSSIEAAYLFSELRSPLGHQLLEIMAVVAEELGSKKVEKILEEVSEEARNYLKQIQEIKEKQSYAS